MWIAWLLVVHILALQPPPLEFSGQLKGEMRKATCSGTMPAGRRSWQAKDDDGWRWRISGPSDKETGRAVKLNIPLILLPEESKEGDILDINIQKDEKETEDAKERVTSLIERLKDKNKQGS